MRDLVAVFGFVALRAHPALAQTPALTIVVIAGEDPALMRMD